MITQIIRHDTKYAVSKLARYIFDRTRSMHSPENHHHLLQHLHYAGATA
jgi:hypothetical protein